MSEVSFKDFDILSETDKAEAVALLNRYEQLEKQDSCQNDFISFVNHMWPDFIEGRHHKIIAEKFNKIAEGKLKRLIVCLPHFNKVNRWTPGEGRRRQRGTFGVWASGLSRQPHASSTLVPAPNRPAIDESDPRWLRGPLPFSSQTSGQE